MSRDISIYGTCFLFWYVCTESKSILFFRFSCSENNATERSLRKGAEGVRQGDKMAAVRLQVIPSFYTNYSKNSLLISANTYEMFIVSKEFYIARHDDKMCFLPNCRYHPILIGNTKDLPQKLDAFCFNYQHVDYLYTLFKYRFSDKNVVKSGQNLDNLQRAVGFNQQNRGVDRITSVAKKRLLRKKYKKNVC